MYEIAGEMGYLTGQPYHVDHVVPLKATFPGSRKRSASGLHAQDNLMVIPGRDNVRKSSKFEPRTIDEESGIDAARGLLYMTRKELGLN